jgi:hypothetical protein
MQTSQRFHCLPLTIVAMLSAWSVAADIEARKEVDVVGTVLPDVKAGDVVRYSRPLRSLDPKTFWNRNRRVYQKSGILIEDDDYVVKERWWELDSRSVGSVVETRQTDRGWVVEVLFATDDGWQPRTFEKQLESETSEQKTVTLTRRGYQAQTLTLTYKVNGVAVDRSQCGLIRRREAAAAYVEFPADLLSYELPRMNEQVMRGPDWFDGYADGGYVPFGNLGEQRGACLGSVTEERNDDGNITIRWDRTGRTSSYRFDNRHGFCDIEKVPDVVANEPAP